MNEKELTKIWMESSSFRDLALYIKFHYLNLIDEDYPRFDVTGDEYTTGFKDALDSLKRRINNDKE